MANSPQNKLFPPPHHEAACHAAPRAATLRRCCYPAPHHQHERLAGAVFRIDPRLVHHQSGRSLKLFHCFPAEKVVVVLFIDRSTRYCSFSLRLAETSGQPAGDLLTETHEHHGFPYLHPGAAKHAEFLAEFFSPLAPLLPPAPPGF